MLPFEAIEEAEIALGRHLRFEEVLWFNYSAKKTDFFLFMHSIIFFSFLYTILPFPLTIMQLIGHKTFSEFKIQPKVTSSLSEIASCYRKVMATFLLVLLPGFTMLYPVIKIIGMRTSLPLPSLWEMLVQLLVYLLVEDYSNYWLHRLLHFEWFYDRIHRVHHEYEAPFGYGAAYLHWGDAVISGLPTFLGPALCPGHMTTFWVWFILRELIAIETHCGYEFSWSPSKYIPFYAGAAHHDYHHFVGGRCKSNFSPIFTYCDYIYGTSKITFRKTLKICSSNRLGFVLG